MLVAMRPERPILVPAIGQGHGTNRNDPGSFIGVQSCELDKIPQTIREILNEELNERFESNKVLTVSMYLGLFFDPRLKELSFLTTLQKREAMKIVKEAYKIRNPNRFPRQAQLECESSDEDNPTENIPKNVNHFAEFDLFRHVAPGKHNQTC